MLAILMIRKIKRMIKRLLEYEDELESNNITPTPRKIKETYNSKVSRSATITELVESIIVPSADRKQSTVDGYRNLAKSIEEFRPNTRMSDLDYHTIEKYRSWMKEKGLKDNTTIGRLKLLRCLTNECIKRNIISTDNDPFRNVVIGEMKPHKEWLTMAELKRLERLRLTGRQAHIRDAFIFCCTTGLRYSDFTSMRSSSLIKNRLTVDQLKTGHIVILPLDKLFGGKPLEILSRYPSIEAFAKIGINSTVNRELKEIGHMANIKTPLHVHLARKACGTLLNQSGLSMQEIQYILGHQRISTTAKHYSFTLQKQVEKSLKKAFKMPKE